MKSHVNLQRKPHIQKYKSFSHQLCPEINRKTKYQKHPAHFTSERSFPKKTFTEKHIFSMIKSEKKFTLLMKTKDYQKTA